MDEYDDLTERLEGLERTVRRLKAAASVEPARPSHFAGFCTL